MQLGMHTCNLKISNTPPPSNTHTQTHTHTCTLFQPSYNTGCDRAYCTMYVCMFVRWRGGAWWQMSHVTYEQLMSYMNELCHRWVSHVTYEWVMSRMNDLCQIWKGARWDTWQAWRRMKRDWGLLLLQTLPVALPTITHTHTQHAHTCTHMHTHAHAHAHTDTMY